MHSVDPTTEQMIRSVLAYAENRLRLNPVPLDEGSRDPAKLDADAPVRMHVKVVRGTHNGESQPVDIVVRAQ